MWLARHRSSFAAASAPPRSLDGRRTAMQYLTQVLGRPVVDSSGEQIGKVRDVIVSPAEPLPVVSALVVKNGTGDIAIPWKQVREEVGRFSLPVSKTRLPRYRPRNGDIFLKRDVMDRQIVDVHDHRMVRVNDVRFVEAPGEVRLLGVDASTRGLLRELGIEWLVRIAGLVVKNPLPEKVIPWSDVQTLDQPSGSVKLKIPLEKLSRLHPSDIAEIIEQMNPVQRADVIESLDIETAADVIPEASPETQAEIMEAMDAAHASDILEEMEPDEAADILGDLSEERTEAILKEMQPEEAEDVRELLAYSDETAGGLMTPDFVSIPADITAAQTIDYLRQLAPGVETIYYLYVTREDNQLVGVVSLKDLILAPPDKPVKELMVTRVVHAHPETGLREVAELFKKYNLLALPVVNFDNEMEGIITVDDMLECVPPQAWRSKQSVRKADHDPIIADAAAA